MLIPLSSFEENQELGLPAVSPLGVAQGPIQQPSAWEGPPAYPGSGLHHIPHMRPCIKPVSQLWPVTAGEQLPVGLWAGEQV